MIDIRDCMKAVGRMTILKYFPPDPIPQSEIAKLLQRMVEKQEHLAWLTDMMVNHVGEWQGSKELRGLLCSRFRPADGIEEYTSIPGFSPADCEARNLEDHERYKQMERGEQRTAQMLPAKEIKMLNRPTEKETAHL